MKKIQGITAKIDCYRKQIQEIPNDISDISEAESQEVEQLKNQLDQKRQDRLHSLLEAKQKIQECMNTIEQTEKVFTGQIDAKQQELEDLDMKYSRDLHSLTRTHEQIIIGVNKQLQERKKKALRLQRVLHELAQGHQKELRVAVDQFRLAERQFGTNIVNGVPDQIQKIGQKKARMKRARHDLVVKEDYLELAWKENQRLRLKIANLRKSIARSFRRVLLSVS
jgi:hypothetical protein